MVYVESCRQDRRGGELHAEPVCVVVAEAARQLEGGFGRERRCGRVVGFLRILVAALVEGRDDDRPEPRADAAQGRVLDGARLLGELLQLVFPVGEHLHGLHVRLG